MNPIVSKSAMETRDAGRNLGETLSPGDVIALTGALGAGKTVFVQGVADSLGVDEAVTSPTFTIISEYEGRMPLYHMDLYRLGSSEEFLWLGVEEMLDGRGISMIEWSERAEEELPGRTIHVNINIRDDGVRDILVKRPETASK